MSKGSAQGYVGDRRHYAPDETLMTLTRFASWQLLGCQGRRRWASPYHTAINNGGSDDGGASGSDDGDGDNSNGRAQGSPQKSLRNSQPPTAERPARPLRNRPKLQRVLILQEVSSRFLSSDQLPNPRKNALPI